MSSAHEWARPNGGNSTLRLYFVVTTAQTLFYVNGSNLIKNVKKIISYLETAEDGKQVMEDHHIAVDRH